jgi:hypothetical protein
MEDNMSTFQTLSGFRRVSAAIGTGLLVAACGGGGGDGAPALIDITAANRDSVAHAAAVAILGPGASNSIPALGSSGPMAAAWRATSGIVLERPQASIPTPPQQCAISGSVTVTFDDRNNNGVLMEVGESATLVFSQCQDDAHEVVSGTTVVTVTGSTQTRWDMTQLSQQATNGRHGMMIDGSFDLSCTEPTVTSTRCTFTASGPLRAVVHTHLFDDTVTLQRGFFEDATYETTTAHTRSTVRGTVASNAAGGAFSVTTDVAIGWFEADPYPHEGELRVSGNRGVMLVAPQSATQSRIDLDSEGDGMYEASKLEDWDWLL